MVVVMEQLSLCHVCRFRVCHITHYLAQSSKQAAAAAGGCSIPSSFISRPLTVHLLTLAVIPLLRVCAIAAGLIGVISLKTAQLTPAGSTAAELAMFLAPYLGIAAAVGLVVAAGKVKQYVQESFYFKNYVQSRSGQ